MDASFWSEIGLSENQAKIYSQLLRSGTCTITSLSHLVGMNRTTLYNWLDQLHQQGFVSEAMESGIKTYRAIPPESIIDQVREKANRLELSLPELKKWAGNPINRFSVEMVKGRKGMLAMHHELLTKAKSYVAFGSFSTLYHSFMKYETIRFRKLRLQSKVRVRGITDSSILDSVYLKTPLYHQYSQIRTLEELKDLTTFTYIYDQTTMALTITDGELEGVIIRDPGIAQTNKLLFEIMWEKAKPIKRGN